MRSGNWEMGHSIHIGLLGTDGNAERRAPRVRPGNGGYNHKPLFEVEWRAIRDALDRFVIEPFNGPWTPFEETA